MLHYHPEHAHTCPVHGASFASHCTERAAGLMSIYAHVTSQPVTHHKWSVSGLDLLRKNPCEWPINRSAGMENKYRETSVATDTQVRDGQTKLLCAQPPVA